MGCNERTRMSIFNQIGKAFSYITTLTMCIAFLMGLAFVRLEWTCSLCGKNNDTNIFRFLLLWCDHEGV